MTARLSVSRKPRLKPIRSQLITSYGTRLVNCCRSQEILDSGVEMDSKTSEKVGFFCYCFVACKLAFL